MMLGQQLTSLAAEVGMQDFNERLVTLQQSVTMWQQGKSPAAIDIDMDGGNELITADTIPPVHAAADTLLATDYMDILPDLLYNPGTQKLLVLCMNLLVKLQS